MGIPAIEMLYCYPIACMVTIYRIEKHAKLVTGIASYVTNTCHHSYYLLPPPDLKEEIMSAVKSVLDKFKGYMK